MDSIGDRPLSTSHRQSSEFYAGESTINYVWQVQCCLKEFVFARVIRALVTLSLAHIQKPPATK